MIISHCPFFNALLQYLRISKQINDHISRLDIVSSKQKDIARKNLQRKNEDGNFELLNHWTFWEAKTHMIYKGLDRYLPAKWHIKMAKESKQRLERMNLTKQNYLITSSGNWLCHLYQKAPNANQTYFLSINFQQILWEIYP